MDAVNLIPADARKRGTSISASPLTLGLIGGLVIILAAAVLYVTAVNDVRSRTSELAQVNASVSSWQAAANSFTAFEQTAQERGAQLASVRQLADGRFPWSQLLSQIGGVMPAKAALSSLQATAPSAAPATTSSTTGVVTPAPTGSTVALTGCAQDESTVALTMEQLRRVSGVSAVSLSAASDGGSGAANAAAPATTGASSGGGGCPFAVQFQMSLTLATSTSAPGASTSPTAATTTATTATTTPQAGASSQ